MKYTYFNFNTLFFWAEYTNKFVKLIIFCGIKIKKLSITINTNNNNNNKWDKKNYN